jgi:hypothetical protein
MGYADYTCKKKRRVYVLAKKFDVRHFLACSITEFIADVAKVLDYMAKNGENVPFIHDCSRCHIALFTRNKTL